VGAAGRGPGLSAEMDAAGARKAASRKPSASRPHPSGSESDPRAVTERGQATRTRIVETAARLMHRNGVSATSVDAVLAAARAGKSQFYHYFSSKDALVAAVLELQASVGEREQSEIFRAHPGWDGVRLWLDAVVAAQRRVGYVGGCPIGSMAAEAADRDPELRRRLAGAFERKRRALRERFEALASRGVLRPDADPGVLASFVVATLQGALLMASTFRDEEGLAPAVEEAWAHLQSYRMG